MAALRKPYMKKHNAANSQPPTNTNSTLPVAFTNFVIHVGIHAPAQTAIR